MVFLDISSLIWRIILGLLVGGILSRITLIITRTKSNITYLYSFGFILRVAVWIIGISLASRFYLDPFDIFTTEAINFVIVAIIIFDSFIMQLITMILGKHSAYPVSKQFSETESKFKEGYIVYNDVPVVSFIYPLFKWIFG
jgi:hypothetical protein